MGCSLYGNNGEVGVGEAREKVEATELSRTRPTLLPPALPVPGFHQFCQRAQC